ncbi:MAG: helix-turn-helix transcriptional regulator [Betaproteobacteria bacterium]|nr:helix-turn-helix transcriptional regulator [Betaproteobacteria bacterium]
MVAIKGAPQVTARQILATNIKSLRAEQGLSQEDLALECDLHRTFIAHVERETRNISLDNIEKIAKALHVPVFRLLTPVHATSKGTVRS